LIGLGLVFLLGQFLRVNVWGFIWPFFIIAVGLTFFAGMLAGGRATGPLALPGSILTTIGLILFVQNTFGIWGTWAYAWGLIIAAVGIGLVLFGRQSNVAELRQVGRVVLVIGLALFFVFGLLFEVGAALFGGRSLGGVLWPLALILAGLYFLVGRPLFRQWSGPVARSEVRFSEVGLARAGEAPLSGEPAAVLADLAGQAAGVRRVSFRGLGDLTIHQGEREGLEIEANQAFRERIRALRNGDALDIHLENAWWDWINPRFWNLDSVRFTLYLRDLAYLNTAGLGNTLVPELRTDRLELVQSGAGNLTLRRLEVEDLTVRQAGLGNVGVEGRAGRQEVDLSGAGNYAAGKLESRAARVRLSGLGNATVWVTEELDGRVSGAGNIEYYGSPRVSQGISGLGNVRHLGAH
jgi:hypothetical protein